jgi:hypothetical protein
MPVLSYIFFFLYIETFHWLQDPDTGGSLQGRTSRGAAGLPPNACRLLSALSATPSAAFHLHGLCQLGHLRQTGHHGCIPVSDCVLANRQRAWMKASRKIYEDWKVWPFVQLIKISQSAFSWLWLKIKYSKIQKKKKRGVMHVMQLFPLDHGCSKL